MLGASVFRIRAYRAAARTVETLGTPAESLLKQDGNALEALPGIGKDLAGKIREIIETGELTLLKELTVQIPESVIQMIRIPGLGPKRAKQIYDQLGIATLAGLNRPRATASCGPCAGGRKRWRPRSSRGSLT